MSPSHQLNIAHSYQEGSIRFHEPHAAQIHIYHTMRGLQRAGHKVSLLALQGRQVLCTSDLQVFKSDKLLAEQYFQLGWSGTNLFKWFESGIRRIQSELRFPYLALFDSYRMAEAGYVNLKGYHLIHERFNLLSLGGAWASKKLGIPLVLEVNSSPGLEGIEAATQRALADFAAGRTVSHDAVTRWLLSLSTANPLPRPKCGE